MAESPSTKRPLYVKQVKQPKAQRRVPRAVRNIPRKTRNVRRGVTTTRTCEAPQVAMAPMPAPKAMPALSRASRARM